MKRLAIAALLAASALACFGLEAKEGLLKIVVDDQTASISVYKLIDIAKNSYEALIYDTDPRTTFPTLSAGGKVFRLSESSEFKKKVGRSDSGVWIEFRSASYVVREDLDFVKSVGAALSDGFKVSFTLENISEQDSSLGLRYLIDTWLGEKSGIHFVTPSKNKIDSEYGIKAGDSDTWIESPGDKANFMVQFAGDGISRPDRVIAANWKRLSDTSWAFDLNPQRNFTLIPYSINDSALALYWDETPVARGAKRDIVFFFGSFNEKGYQLAQAKSSTEDIFSTTVLNQGSPDKTASMEADLVSVRDLLTRINQGLASGTLSPDELAAWQKILDRLEERKKDY